MGFGVRLIRAAVVEVEEKMVVDDDGSCTFWILLLLLLLLLMLLLVLVLWLLLLCWLLGGRRWRGWQLLVVMVVGLVGRRSGPTLVRGRRHQRSRLSACCRRLLLPQLPADHGSAIHVRVLRGGATAEEERGPRRGLTAAAATAAGPHRRRDARHCADGEGPTPTAASLFRHLGVASSRERAHRLAAANKTSSSSPMTSKIYRHPFSTL